MSDKLKNLVRVMLGKLGYAFHRQAFLNGFEPASATRPIGRLSTFFEDIRARGFKPRGIIDVGAYCGEWSKIANGVFPECPVIMIEPQQEMSEHLLAISKQIPNSRVVLAGAGSKAGELVQTLSGHPSAASFLPIVIEELVVSKKQKMTPIVTLDSILSDDATFYPDLVKLDVQGFELEVLKGADSFFGVTEIFIIETSLYPFLSGQPVCREVIRFMAERNYEIYDISDYSRRPSDGALGQIDFVFAKASGILRSHNEW